MTSVTPSMMRLGYVSNAPGNWEMTSPSILRLADATSLLASGS
jgi:hypothetical protein